jgi:transposase
MLRNSAEPAPQCKAALTGGLQQFAGGETFYRLAKRHSICRNLIWVWVAKFEAGAFDEDAEAASLITDYEARIAALERLVGRQAFELEFLKGALKSTRSPRSGPTSVISGPPASPSSRDGG